MQEELCFCFTVPLNMILNYVWSRNNYSSTNAVCFYPVKQQIIGFRSGDIILSSQKFDVKMNKVSFVKKFGQLNQRDQQFVRDNIQQNLFFGKILFILVCFHNT